MPPSGPYPVVLAPGLLCDERLWAPVRARLEMPAAVVDFRACDSLEAMAELLIGVAPQPSVLGGFSMGGMAAILAAAWAPERFVGVMILDTHVERDTPERREGRLRQIETAKDQAAFEQLVQDLPLLYWAQAGAGATLVIDMAMAQGRAVFARHVKAIMERPDLAAAAGALRLPVQVVCGREDRIAPPALAQRMADLIPGAELTVLEACGHMAPLDQPDAVAQIIRRTAACT